MNYLAHTFLSGWDAELMIGNFIADFINAKQARMLDHVYQKGLGLHRKIDSFTDKHTEFRKGTKRLSQFHGKYSPVVLDILYDHLLAINWSSYSDLSLSDHAMKCYGILEEHLDVFIEQGVDYIPRMISHDFLAAYAKPENVVFVLTKMDQRTRFASQFVNALDHLEQDFDLYNSEFNTFFPEIIEMSKAIVNT